MNPLPRCSAPTLLDGLDTFVDSKNLSISQIYNEPDRYAPPDIESKVVVNLYLGEYVNWEFFDKLLCLEKFLYDKTGKVKKYHIFITPHPCSDFIKTEYTNQYTEIEEPLLYSYYSSHIGKLDIDLNAPKKCHFLSLNNRASPHRQSLYYFLEKFSMKDKFYFSYLGELHRTDFNSFKDISDACTSDGVPWYLKKLNLEELNLNIPIKINGDTFDRNDWSYGQPHYYTDSFCSVVMETYVAEQYAFLTEKTFKPIAFFQPFILDSNKGGLQLLKKLGFKTFSDFWDEDYDNLIGNQRLEAMFHLILEISNWSIEKINKVYTAMHPILQYNHEHFYNELPKMFDERKPKLFEEIKTIVKSKERLLECGI